MGFQSYLGGILIEKRGKVLNTSIIKNKESYENKYCTIVFMRNYCAKK